jgi:hypothetical protein
MAKKAAACFVGQQIGICRVGTTGTNLMDAQCPCRFCFKIRKYQSWVLVLRRPAAMCEHCSNLQTIPTCIRPFAQRPTSIALGISLGPHPQRIDHLKLNKQQSAVSLTLMSFLQGKPGILSTRRHTHGIRGSCKSRQYDSIGPGCPRAPASSWRARTAAKPRVR